MRKLNIVWASPLRPQATGIAPYVEGLLKKLAPELNLTVLYDESHPTTDFSDWPVKPLALGDYAEQEGRNPFDLAVYHMGNNPLHVWIWRLLQQRSGLVVLHDALYHHFFFDQSAKANQFDGYIRNLLHHHGAAGVELGEKLMAAAGTPASVALEPRMFDYSLVAPVLHHASRVIVHNRSAEEEVRRVSGIPCDMIPLYFDPAEGYLPGKAAETGRFGVPAHVPLLISIGFVGPHKRFDRIIRALGQLHRAQVPFRFINAGNVSPDLPFNLPDLIRSEGLEQQVELRGYISDREMFELLSAADIAVNLRYPTAGESSASLVRFLGAGLPTLVTDHGASSEFPDDVVCKIPFDENEDRELIRHLHRFLTSPEERQLLGASAKNHVMSHHHIDRVADLYLRSIEAACNRPRPESEPQSVAFPSPVADPPGMLAPFSRWAKKT